MHPATSLFFRSSRYTLLRFLRSTSTSFEALIGVRTKTESAIKGSVDPPDAVSKANLEAARAVSRSFMFPWERRQMDGENVPLRTWEKIYWWVFVGGFAVLLISWNQRSVSSSKGDREEVDRELEAKKEEMARAVLAGKSLVNGDDPFDGYTPRQIEEFVKSSTGVSSDDPYEGMTPEEINNYVAKHGT